MTADFKPSAARPPLARIAVVIVIAGLLVVVGVVVGRLTAPEPPPAPAAPPGIRYVEGVPTGFPRTARGAGDAAAWYETLISAASSLPHDQVQALITRLVHPEVRSTLVNELMPSTVREGNRNISQTVVARVWAERATDGTELPDGTQVKVKTYGVGLFGARTDGQISGPNTGLAGGFVVHDLVMQLDGGQWRLRTVDTPIPAPPPDLRGLTRDGGPRNTQLLAEVLGPDSWVPQMP